MTKPVRKFKAWARKVDGREDLLEDLLVSDGIEVLSFTIFNQTKYYIGKGSYPYLYLRRDLQWHETCGDYGIFSTEDEARETLQRHLQTL